MNDHYETLLRIVVAQIAKNIGFNAASVSCLDVLQDLLAHVMETLTSSTHRYMEHADRVDPIIDDVGMAFVKMGISVRELAEYLSQATPVEFQFKLPDRNETGSLGHMLNIPRPDHPELKTRPDYIPRHLPLLKPDTPPKQYAKKADVDHSPMKNRKGVMSSQEATEDWLSDLLEFDAFKAGLVKTVALPPSPKTPEPVQLQPATDLSYEISKTGSKMKKQARGAIAETSTIEQQPVGPFKMLPRKRADLLLDQSIAAVASSPKSTLAPTLQLSPLVVTLPNIQQSIHASPTTVHSSSTDKSSSDASISIDECISSVIEQTASGFNVRKKETIPPQFDFQFDLQKPSTSTSNYPSAFSPSEIVSSIVEKINSVAASDQKRSAFIQAAVREVREVADDVLNEANFVRNLIDDGAPQKPPDVQEDVTFIGVPATKVDVGLKTPLGEKQRKKRKERLSGLTPPPAKRIPPPPMPAVDLSSLFKPDVTLITPRKVVSPLVLQKPKTSNINPPVPLMPALKSVTPSQLQLSKKLKASPVIDKPAIRKVGSLKIKLKVPQGKEKMKSKLGKIEKPEKNVATEKARVASPVIEISRTSSSPQVDTLKREKELALILPRLKFDNIDEKSTETFQKLHIETRSIIDEPKKPSLSLKLKVPKLILKLGPKPQESEETTGQAARSQSQLSTGGGLKLKISPQPLVLTVTSSPNAASTPSSSSSMSRFDWPPESASSPHNERDTQLRPISPAAASPPPPTPSPRSVMSDDDAETSAALLGGADIVERVEWPSGMVGDEPATPEPPGSVDTVLIGGEEIPQEEHFDDTAPKSISSSAQSHATSSRQEGEGDADGDGKVWYCPVCQVPYQDGVDMIACDKCDNWFHWICVGLTKAPPDHEQWYCPGCQAKKSKQTRRKSAKK